MANFSFSHIESDVLSLLFCFMIYDFDLFSSFSRVLIAWATKSNAARIKNVLERLDWDKLYQFHNHIYEVTRDAFHGFIGFAIRYRVDQTMFYDSVRNLFHFNNIELHLHTLQNMSCNHLPSRFAYIFCKAVYRPFEGAQTAKEMYVLLGEAHLRGKITDIMNLLEDIYFELFETDYLLPVYKFCPDARNSDPIYQLDGMPFENEFLLSLCKSTIDEDYSNLSRQGRILTMDHIWDTPCMHCKLQMVLFKILLGAAPI